MKILSVLMLGMCSLSLAGCDDRETSAMFINRANDSVEVAKINLQREFYDDKIRVASAKTDAIVEQIQAESHAKANRILEASIKDHDLIKTWQPVMNGEYQSNTIYLTSCGYYQCSYSNYCASKVNTWHSNATNGYMH